MSRSWSLSDRRTDTARPWLIGLLLLPLAGVAAALVTQHVFHMQPCPWCVLQRLIFLAIALLAGAALLWRSAGARKLLGGGMAALALAGAAAALWQHVVAAESASCAQTLADRIMGFTQLDRALPEVFAAYASCADAKAWLLGVPYEYCSLALFVALGAAAWQVLRGRS